MQECDHPWCYEVSKIYSESKKLNVQGGHVKYKNKTKQTTQFTFNVAVSAKKTVVVWTKLTLDFYLISTEVNKKYVVHIQWHLKGSTC